MYRARRGLNSGLLGCLDSLFPVRVLYMGRYCGGPRCGGGPGTSVGAVSCTLSMSCSARDRWAQALRRMRWPPMVRSPSAKTCVALASIQTLALRSLNSAQPPITCCTSSVRAPRRSRCQLRAAVLVSAGHKLQADEAAGARRAGDPCRPSCQCALSVTASGLMARHSVCPRPIGHGQRPRLPPIE